MCAVRAVDGAHNDARDARRSAPRDAHALLPSRDGDGGDGANRARPRRVRAPATTRPRRIPRDDEDVPRGGRVRARSKRRRRPRIGEEDRGRRRPSRRSPSGAPGRGARAQRGERARGHHPAHPLRLRGGARQGQLRVAPRGDEHLRVQGASTTRHARDRGSARERAIATYIPRSPRRRPPRGSAPLDETRLP